MERHSLSGKRARPLLIRGARTAGHRRPLLAETIDTASWPALNLSSTMPLTMGSHTGALSVTRTLPLNKMMTSAVNVGNLAAIKIQIAPEYGDGRRASSVHRMWKFLAASLASTRTRVFTQD